MYSISNLLIQSSINSFGTDTIAAWTAYAKVDSNFWMIMSAYGVSATTFAGQNFGVGKYDRIKKASASVWPCRRNEHCAELYRTAVWRNDPLLFTHDQNESSASARE